MTAFFGALLAIFLTPRFQHYFWKRQKREEIRLSVVTEVNRLAAEFTINYFFKDNDENTPEVAFTFAQSWTSVSGQVRDLFSEPTYQVFTGMDTYITTAPVFDTKEIMDRVPHITDFTRVRDPAMQALYKEIGILNSTLPIFLENRYQGKWQPDEGFIEGV